MNEADECKHGMNPAWCSACKEGPRRPRPATVEATFCSRYDGQCPACNLPIIKGQVIHRMSNDTYVHEGCE